MIAEILTLIIAASAASYATAQVLNARHKKRFDGLRREAKNRLHAANERLEGSIRQVSLLKTEIELLRSRDGVHRAIWSDAAVPKHVIREPSLPGLEVSGFPLTQPFEEFAASVQAEEVA